jgi:hypothetical protein
MRNISMCIYLKDDVLSFETQTQLIPVTQQVSSQPVVIPPVIHVVDNQIPAYVYKLVCKPTGQFYYGYRKLNIDRKRLPKDDFWIYYFTSSTYVEELIDKYGKNAFEYEIIFESTDIDAVYWYEQDIIKQHRKEPLSLNKHCIDNGGTVKFVTTSKSAKKGYQTRLKNNTVTKIRATKRWRLTSPTGEVIEINNLEKYCKENGLRAASMNSVDKGRITNHRGWTCICLSTPQEVREEVIRKNTKVKLDKNTMDHPHDQNWELTNPLGVVFQIKNLERFCRDNGLAASSMRAVSNGLLSNHRDWNCKRLESDRIDICYQWDVIDPVGIVYHTAELKAFCEEHDLGYTSMLKVASGELKQHRGGWKCIRNIVEKSVVCWEVINPSGDITIVDDMKQFCNINGISYNRMYDVAMGYQLSHRGGWKCKRLD